MTTIKPLAEFNWLMVQWRGPKQTPGDRCSYCGAVIPDDDVPLMMWNKEGWCAQFCEACRLKCWGME